MLTVLVKSPGGNLDGRTGRDCSAQIINKVLHITMSSFASPDPVGSGVSSVLSSRHFFPKFDNLRAEEQDPISIITEEDVLLVTKKHSGSLIMLHAVLLNSLDPVHGWVLVVNSKNGTNNEFSIAAEHYFRAQFKAIFGNEADKKMEEFAVFLGLNSFTFCFEFVTSFLGDHGERPHLPYAVLTSITQFNEVTMESRFASLPEMVDMAHRYHLILNEMWVVPARHAREVSDGLRGLRWTGEDDDFTSYMDAHAAFKVHSVLPHAIGQGQLLEGLVVQVCRASSDVLGEMQQQSSYMLADRERLVSGLEEFGRLQAVKDVKNWSSFSPPTKANPISDVRGFLTAHGEGDAPINLLFRQLSELEPNKLKFVSLKRVDRCGNSSVIIHVHQDQIFFDYAKKKSDVASHLYRGMEVFTSRVVPSVPLGEVARLKYVSPELQWRICGISKWKNWQYLKRTFCMRNSLSTLFCNGFDTYMAHVIHQFQIWGLPSEYHGANHKLLSAWGKWLLLQNGAKKSFMTNSNKFSYLSFLHKFLPLYESGLLDGLGTDSAARKDTVLFLISFVDPTPPWALRLLDGYVVNNNFKANKQSSYHPGMAYVFNAVGRLPVQCPCPHFVVIVPPPSICLNDSDMNKQRRNEGLYNSFKYNLDAAAEVRAEVQEVRAEEDVPAVCDSLRDFEGAVPSKRVFLVVFAGLPPGSGKSTLADAIMKNMEANGELTTVMVSSDYFGAIHGPGTSAASNAFGNAVVEALWSGVDVVLFDKNIPEMNGYYAMAKIAARAALPKLTIVPIVPQSLGLEEVDLCLQRVLSRTAGSHTLTAESKIEGFPDVANFVSEKFGKPCINFIPIAQLLPGAIVLDGMFDVGAVANNAKYVVDQLANWDSRQASLSLLSGDYLGLCFELPLSCKVVLEGILGVSVRELLHATIAYYGKDKALMAEAGRLLKTLDTTKPVVVQMHRLGLVQGAGGGVLAWGSLSIPGFSDRPMHSTLVADKFPAFFANACEAAYDSGKVCFETEVNGEKVLEELLIQRFEIDPLNFEATWSVC